MYPGTFLSVHLQYVMNISTCPTPYCRRQDAVYASCAVVIDIAKVVMPPKPSQMMAMLSNLHLCEVPPINAMCPMLCRN